MFGLDLSRLSPQLEGTVETLIIVLLALILLTRALIAGQGMLERLQDSMSETERGERLGAKKRIGIPKKKGPSEDHTSEGVRGKGKHALGEKKERGRKQKREEKASKWNSLYPVKELEALGLDSSDTDELSPSEEEDLEEEAARYEEQRYHPDELVAQEA